MGRWLNPKNIFVVAAALLIGGAFVFRSPISKLLDFGQDAKMGKVIESAAFPKSIVEEASKPDLPLKEATSYVEPPTPLYNIGRDPAEIRPVPEEVKLFTEEQKNRLYQTIRTHAQAVKLDPLFFGGWIQIGILKKTIGDFEGARDAWEYAGRIQPKNSLSFANLGELYWRYLHDYPRSEANLKISIAHKPEDIQTHVSLAELYHYSYKEKYELADDVLLDGLKFNLGDGTLMRRLAYLYEQRGEWVKALEWWQKVAEGAPQDTEVAVRISRVKEKLEGESQ